jgi:hypothetical protein
MLGTLKNVKILRGCSETIVSFLDAKSRFDIVSKRLSDAQKLIQNGVKKSYTFIVHHL